MHLLCVANWKLLIVILHVVQRVFYSLIRNQTCHARFHHIRANKTLKTQINTNTPKSVKRLFLLCVHNVMNEPIIFR